MALICTFVFKQDSKRVLQSSVIFEEQISLVPLCSFIFICFNINFKLYF